MASNRTTSVDGPVAEGEIRFQATPTLEADVEEELWDEYDLFVDSVGDENAAGRDEFSERVRRAVGLLRAHTKDDVVSLPRNSGVDDITSLARWLLAEAR